MLGAHGTGISRFVQICRYGLHRQDPGFVVAGRSLLLVGIYDGGQPLDCTKGSACGQGHGNCGSDSNSGEMGLVRATMQDEKTVKVR